MIRVSKSVKTPASLEVDNCTSYNGQDVQEALVADQKAKCYLCEQHITKSFEIEHLKPKAAGRFPELKYTWSNLFLSCPYCNGRKPNDYNLLDPLTNDIEEIIEHRINLALKLIVLTTEGVATVREDYTIRLLDRLFNGKNKLRDIKGGLLYKDLEREIVFFLGVLNDYKTLNSADNKQKVIDSLLITKEFLAFKYWILKDNDLLYNDFKDNIVWNRMA